MQDTIKSYDWIAERYSEVLNYVVKKLDWGVQEFGLQSELYKIMMMLTGGKSLLTIDIARKYKEFNNEEH